MDTFIFPHVLKWTDWDTTKKILCLSHTVQASISSQTIVAAQCRYLTTERVFRPRIVEQGVYETRPGECHTALSYAAFCGQLDVVRYLISTGFLDREEHCWWGYPIASAARVCPPRSIPILELLLQHGLGTVDDLKRALTTTFKHHTCPSKGECHFHLFHLLLPKAAHLQCAGELLRHAVYWGEHQALTRLLEGGVDANFGCAAALRYAILKRDTKSIDILVQFGADVNVSNGALLREAILHSKRGCYDMVVYLVQKGALCTYRVLETAAKDEGLFRMLLSHMVDPNYNEVLCAAAAGPHKDLITEIVQREGVNVKYRESMPLRQAARKGTAETVQLLIDLGCDIHSRNNEALAWAALGGNVDTMRLLLDHGADASAMNGRALRKAVSHHMWKDPEVVKLLIQRQKTTVPPQTQIAGIDEALITAAQCGDLNVIRVLLDDGAADPEASDNRALRVAAAFGERALVSLLLDRATYIHTQPERVALLRQLVEESDGPSREGVEHAAFAGWVELETFLRETPYVDPFNREP